MLWIGIWLCSSSWLVQIQPHSYSRVRKRKMNIFGSSSILSFLIFLSRMMVHYTIHKKNTIIKADSDLNYAFWQSFFWAMDVLVLAGLLPLGFKVVCPIWYEWFRRSISILFHNLPINVFVGFEAECHCPGPRLDIIQPALLSIMTKDTSSVKLSFSTCRQVSEPLVRIWLLDNKQSFESRFI